MSFIGPKRVRDIKKSQKEKLLFREISQLFLSLSLDNRDLRSTSITRVELSADKSTCYVYFYGSEGKEYFENTVLNILKLYRPSLRKAIAATIKARYTPEIIFKYDDSFEKQSKIHTLLDKIKKEE